MRRIPSPTPRTRHHGCCACAHLQARKSSLPWSASRSPPGLKRRHRSAQTHGRHLSQGRGASPLSSRPSCCRRLVTSNRSPELTFTMDAEVAAVLQAALEKNGPPPTPQIGDVPTRRVTLDAMLEYFNNQAQPLADDVKITDHEVTTAAGATLLARWYWRPASDTGAPRPVPPPGGGERERGRLK